ncbi:sphingomyelin phosphodiesterase 1 [Teleopsis dalmanni]|uniref:sphingomyelin phosphodiesterase 1 n=1 Tax=Teleopsis dalmanni TaxID=139649 RepID=UPI0018CD2E30|nr:sphingomyelin phosphodiesterase 1 [Teleopsis dalmanni]
MLWTAVLAFLVVTTNAFNLPGVPTDFSDSDEVLSSISDDIANKFAEEYITFLKTNVETAALRQISKQLSTSHSKKDLFTQSTAELGAADQFFLCTTCRASLNVLTKMFLSPDGELNGPNAEDDTKKVFLDVCKRLDLQTEEVCSGLFDLNYHSLIYILQNTVADTRTMCGTLPIRFCQVKHEKFEWSLNVDSTGPVITGPKDEFPNKSDQDLKILHLTDIHFDPEYKSGSLAECPEPLCCRNTPENIDVDKQAGYWSDYRDCDSPLHMIEDAFDHIKETHEVITYIYHTGDIVPHNVWSTTKDGNQEMITKISQLIYSKFPEIPVYPCIGNHEPHPTNVFGNELSPNEFSVKWLYEHLYTVWSKWLPDETKETILKGGYYTLSPSKGLRIISLNNNDCYLFNWWIYFDGSYATEQLNWLHETLLAAEKANEYVHILAHIPSGDSDCWTVWSREYNRIIERFSHIIGGIFNGHTHKNEINVHYTADNHAIGLSWNGGSLTSYSYKNPNYKIYDVDPIKLQVVDEETWIFNLTEANVFGAEKKPVWYKAYQFSKEFTNDLSPAGIDALLEKFAENPELLRKYWQHKITLGDPSLQKGCDNKCLMTTICRLATTSYHNKTRCKALQSKLEQTLTSETTPAPTTKRPTGEDDGAASLIALSLTTILVVCLSVRYIV